MKSLSPPAHRNTTHRFFAIYGEAYAAAGDPATARHWYERTKQILTDLRGAGELEADGAEMLQEVEKELAKAR